MSSVRGIFWTALAVGAALTLSPSTASATGVVVATSGPSAGKYPVGHKVADDERIVLVPGDTLTVLDAKGTRVFKGAGTYQLSAEAGPSKSSAFALLTRERSAQRMRTGAVRGETGGPITRPNLWYVDTAASGPTCIPNTDEIRLWRATTNGDATYSIKPVGGQSATQAVFHDGEMLSPWNTTALPVKDGSSFVISPPDGAGQTVTFKVLDSVPDQPDALAEDLIAHGCTAQLDLLAKAMQVDQD